MQRTTRLLVCCVARVRWLKHCALFVVLLTCASAVASPKESTSLTDGTAAEGASTAVASQQPGALTTVVQPGPRPYYLVNDMDPGPLQRKLASCSGLPVRRSLLSIGHRGAPLKFPEHTRESYIAAARMGAGIIECDVTFTADQQLVCRHSQCDLHTTTNILSLPELAKKCSVPFKPARFDQQGNRIATASARCCTSDITLAEFKTLRGKIDTANESAVSVAEYIDGTAASLRTDLYATNGTVVTHAESIALFKELGVKMIPELKAPAVPMPYANTYTQRKYAQHLLDEYKKAGVRPDDVWVQSFSFDDIRYWIEAEPAFARQAVLLDGRYRDKSFESSNPASWAPSMEALFSAGVRVLAPPIWMLVTLAPDGSIVPSVYANAASRAGLKLIAWTLERSGPLAGGGGWYYQTIADAINNDGDVMTLLDVLVKDVGVTGVFSDWPATVSYYANCMGIE